MPKVSLFIDPGLSHTGFAFFPEIQREGETVHPLHYGVIHTRRSGIITRSRSIVRELQRHMKNRTLKLLYLEYPEYWAHARSQVSFSKGELHDLCFLIGGIVFTLCDKAKPKVILRTPREWKGNLPKEVVVRRIQALSPGLGKIVNHAADAVGMGYSWQGVL